MKTVKPLIFLSVLSAAGGLMYWQFADISPETHTGAPTSATSTGTSATQNPVQGLEQEPEVTAYLQREANKHELQAFFAGTGEMDAQEAWTLIDDLERDQRVLGFEALHLKLAWLEKQHTNREKFESAAQALMDDYRKRAQSQPAYNPEDIPGYTDYKARELAIIEQINSMQTFPNGMSREEYLREQLLEARLEAYGEKR